MVNALTSCAILLVGDAQCGMGGGQQLNQGG